MPFPDLPPERIPGSPGHLNDHQLIDQALDYIQQSGYRDDPNFPPLPDIPVLGQSGHVTAHDRILAILEYVKANPSGAFVWATVSNTPTGTYKGDDGHTYAYYLFESDGTLTVTTAGLLDVLLVGAGGGTADWSSGNSKAGNGGDIVTGLHTFDASAHAVTIGTSKANSCGGPSSLGNLTTTIAGSSRFTSNGVGAGGTLSSPARGYTSAITGTNETYAPAGDRSRPGGGALKNPNTGGASGVVIVRTRLN